MVLVGMEMAKWVKEVILEAATVVVAVATKEAEGWHWRNWWRRRGGGGDGGGRDGGGEAVEVILAAAVVGAVAEGGENGEGGGEGLAAALQGWSWWRW